MLWRSYRAEYENIKEKYKDDGIIPVELSLYHGTMDTDPS
jgi:hypothetical protein